MAIKLYPHNQETYAKVVTMFETSNRVGIVQPTGTGKSFIYLKWIEDNPDDTFIIIAPSTEIFVQLQEYANEAGLPHLLDRATMLTYQKLLRMTQEELQALRTNKIIVDEFHRGGAKQWELVLLVVLDRNPDALVLGASATPVRYLDDARDMASELFDSNLAVEMTLGEAVKRGILPEPKMIAVWYDLDGNRTARYKEDIANIHDQKKRKEMEKRLEGMRRQMEEAYGVEKVMKNYLMRGNEKLIVFCRNKEHLENMLSVAPKWLNGINSNVRMYKSIALQADKDDQLWAFKEDNREDAIKLLFVIDRLNEGIHVKGIDGVIMLRPTTSPIVYLQQMGRALAAGNNVPLIFDFVNNHHSAKIILPTGESINAFQWEYTSGANVDGKGERFRIFENVVQFQDVIDNFEESLLTSNNNKSWDFWLKLLSEYMKEFKATPSRKTIYCGYNLGGWCRSQRKHARKGKLTPEQIKKLTDVGFSFDPINDAWNRGFGLYCDYKAEFNCEPVITTEHCGHKLGLWCKMQRENSRRGILSAEQFQKLNDAGFVFEFDTMTWDEMFALYCNYKAEYNCEPADKVIYCERRLGYWCKTQRTNNNKGGLSAERMQKLTDAGFVFAPKERNWNERFALYCDYKAECGHEPTGTTIYRGQKIGSWCREQRGNYRMGRLTREHAQMLTEAGFIFEPIATSLEKTLIAYKNFKAEYGCEPTASTIYCDINLGSWCATQRSLYKNGKLPEDRISRLKEAGFAFEVDTGKWPWEDWFDLYCEYKGLFSHEPTHATIFHERKLGRWCMNQRANHKKGKLSAERIKKLADVGFAFEAVVVDDKRWNEMFNLCCEYKSGQGREPTNTTVFCGQQLGSWYKRQKAEYKKGILLSNRIQKLVAAGFALEKS